MSPPGDSALRSAVAFDPARVHGRDRTVDAPDRLPRSRVNRLVGASPVVIPQPPRWQQRLACAIHIVLYALMLAMPILGWFLLSAAGKPVPFFGARLPALLAENKDLAERLKEVHETIGTIGYFLIGAHALAALFHHYVTRDNTLVRMLPGKS